MKYLYLLYGDESGRPAPDSPEMGQVQDAYSRFFEEVNGAGAFKGGDPVQGSSTSTTVRVRNGSVERAEGPFAPGADQIIGFYVLECASDDEAVQYAAKIPVAAQGAVEVRPILAQA